VIIYFTLQSVTCWYIMDRSSSGESIIRGQGTQTSKAKRRHRNKLAKQNKNSLNEKVRGQWTVCGFLQRRIYAGDCCWNFMYLTLNGVVSRAPTFFFWIYDSQAIATPFVACQSEGELDLGSETVVDPARPRPVVDVRRRPELESDADTTSRWRTLQRVDHSGQATTSNVNHVTDVLLQRHRQRQSVDASSARIHQVSCDHGSTAILQVAETAHARDQRHFRLRRYMHRQTHHINSVITLTVFSGKRNASVWYSSVRLSVPYFSNLIIGPRRLFF